MKTGIGLIAAIMLFAACNSGDGPAGSDNWKDASLNSLEDSMAYVVGIQQLQGLPAGLEISGDGIYQGLIDEKNEDEGEVSDEQVRKIIGQFQLEVQARGAQDTTEASFQIDADSLSYAIGRVIGDQFAKVDLEYSAAAMARGMYDAYYKNEFLIPTSEHQVLGVQFSQMMQEKTQDLRAAEGEANKAEEAEYFAELRNNPEIQSLPSGVMYEVLEAGTGEQPDASSMVTVHYEGRLLNGDVFDSSYERGQPATFQLTGLIPAWQEALPQMRKGSKWRIYAPAMQAYGERGSGPQIGPFAALVFEIELLEIAEGAEAPAMP